MPIQTGTLRLVKGQRAEGTPPGVAVLTPPLHPAAQRAAETFVMLLDMGDQAPSWLYREVRAATAREFWSTPGGVTAALRHAVATANRAIFRYNLQAAPPQRVYGAISCAALTENEVFVAQAGPACICAWCAGSVERFPRQDLPPLGSGAYAEIQVTYLPIQPGDRLILASYRLSHTVSDDALRRVLMLEESAAMLDALEQVAAGQDIFALILFWRAEAEPLAKAPQRRKREREVETVPVAEAPFAPLPQRPHAPPEQPAAAPAPPRPLPGLTVSEPPARPWEPVETEEAPEEAWEEETAEELWEEEPAPEAFAPTRPAPPVTGRKRLQVGSGLQSAWHRLGDAVTAGRLRLRLLMQRPQPAAERTAPARPRLARRPPQPENARLMAGIAAAILLIVALITVFTWASYGGAARRQQALSQAEYYATQAREATSREEQRAHWAAVIQTLSGAGLAQAPESATLLAEAQSHIDQLDNVIRVYPTLLWPPQGGGSAQRLVVHATYAFVLDPVQQAVLKLNLSATGQSVTPENEPILQTGEERNGQRVGNLIDMAWNQSRGEWPMDCLVVLDAKNQLWVYDPAWPDNTYALSLEPTPGQGQPLAIETFEGRLYLLDRQAQQVWRYWPRSSGYVEEAQPYFEQGAPQSMAQARDLAIDGNIYLLLEDGSVAKYFGGNPVSFEVRGVPPPTPRFVALAVDPEMAGRIYLADAAAERIVILNEGGSYRSQLRAPASEMQGLQALALDPPNSRLFFIASGHLYVVPLPSTP